MSDYEKTGKVNFKGLTDSITSTPKQTEVRDKATGETKWVEGKAGDGNKELGNNVAKGNWSK